MHRTYSGLLMNELLLHCFLVPFLAKSFDFVGYRLVCSFAGCFVLNFEAGLAFRKSFAAMRSTTTTEEASCLDSPRTQDLGASLATRTISCSIVNSLATIVAHVERELAQFADEIAAEGFGVVGFSSFRIIVE